MEGPTQTLMIVGVAGSVISAAFGALAGAELRIPPPVEEVRYGAVSLSADDLFLASAPAYPQWAPEPLYPRAERDPVDAFAAAWDAAMMDAPRGPQPAVFGPPSDLPPPYEVRLEGEARAAEARAAEAQRYAPQVQPVAYAAERSERYVEPARYSSRPQTEDGKAAY